MDWRSPLDEFTLRFLIAQLTSDREGYLRMAKEIKGLDDGAGEAFMIRAEECGRIVQQLRRQLDKTISIPPPPPPHTREHSEHSRHSGGPNPLDFRDPYFAKKFP